MTTYYFDTAAASSTSPFTAGWAQAGTTQANMQYILDTLVAGDILYARGSLTLTASLDFDTASGTNTGGFIQIIGCNASGVNDGTRFVIDGNSAATNCLAVTTKNYGWVENVEFKNATGHGVEFALGTDTTGWVFNNCSFNNNGDQGLNGFRMNSGTIIRCTCHNNTQEGCTTDNGTRVLFSSFHDNGGVGMNLANNLYATIFGCLIFSNTSHGINDLARSGILMNSVVDGNGNGGVIVKNTLYLTAVIGNRITNHSTTGEEGIYNEGTYPLLHGWNYFEDNDGDNIQNNTNVLDYEILNDGAATNQEDQADTLEGYTSTTADAEDLNLATGATGLEQEIVIPTGL